MEYVVTVLKTTRTEQTINVDVPEILSGIDETILDRAVWAQARVGNFELAEGTVIEEMEQIVSVYRGEKRVFPREEDEVTDVTFKPVEDVPTVPQPKGRWRDAVVSFVDSGILKAEVDIGDTPVTSAQTMCIVAARSLGMADLVGVSRRGNQLYFYRRDQDA